MILLKLLFIVLSLFFVKAYNNGGRSAVAHPYPFMVSLQQITKNTIFKYCSGVIISESWVLSNAQCVDGTQEQNIVVVAGTLKAYNFNHRNLQVRNISKVIRHPKYKYTKGEIPKFDLVMLKMNKPFNFRPNVQSVTLGATRFVSGHGEIVGWGATQGPDDENQSDDLLFTDVDVVDYNDCVNYYKDVKDKFCAGNFKQTACFGDGGGPFVQYESVMGYPIVVGLASATAIPCGSKPALYTNLAYYQRFITNTIENE